MIYLGIDDTDTLETAGTNQLAREIVNRLSDRLRCVSIVRHQLFFDPRVPYTSKNGSASICLERIEPLPLEKVIEHYSREVKPHPNVDGRLRRPLNFNTAEKAALVAFLKTLSDQKFLTDPKFSDPYQ